MFKCPASRKRVLFVCLVYFVFSLLCMLTFILPQGRDPVMGNAPVLAKRMECGELAPAFGHNGGRSVQQRRQAEAHSIRFARLGDGGRTREACGVR
jgi:hypothetical protein